MDQRRSHPEVVALLQGAMIARGIESVIRRVGAAARSSRAMAAGRRLAAPWRAADRGHQRLALGILLMIAVVTHIATTVLHQVPAGWMWLVVPAIGFAEGAVLVLAGTASRKHQ